MEILLDPSPYDAITKEEKINELEILPSSKRIARHAVRLYSRCRMFSEIALPGPGSVLEQNERIVRLLELVHNEMSLIQSERLTAISHPLPDTTKESFTMGKSYSRKVR